MPESATRSGLRRAVSVLIALLAIAWLSEAWGQTKSSKRRPDDGPVVADFRSRHFLVHTDLRPKEAGVLLERLETMLGLISGYWGRPSSGIIECYVVKDLENWADDLVAGFHPRGLAKIREGAGICLGETLSSGDRFVAKGLVYAVAQRGIPQHEAVHAYCIQTFGRCGPQWYAEGMAEIGQYWAEGKKGIATPPQVVQYLKKSPRRTLAELIVTEETRGGSWQDYAWWWSLCYLLESNPNYTSGFRALGMGLLTGKEVSFHQVFTPIAVQLDFEHGFFIEHFDRGYRVDLCAWDWKKKFKPLRTTLRTMTTKVQAAKGWQPTGLTVDSGAKYTYTATGKWRVGKDRPTVNADGDTEGQGRLTGILMRDFKLSRPFELGSQGTLLLGANGNLYVRCRDAWNQLADNSGRVTLKVKAKSATKASTP